MAVGRGSLLRLRLPWSGYCHILPLLWLLLILSARPSGAPHERPQRNDHSVPDPGWDTASLVVGVLTLAAIVGVAALFPCYSSSAGNQRPALHEYKWDDLRHAIQKARKKEEKRRQGSAGAVFKATLPREDRSRIDVAIKKFDSALTEESSLQVRGNLEKRLFKHQNVVPLLGYCLNKKTLYLVYKYMDRGSLDRHLFNGPSSLPWDKRSDIIKGVARGLNCLHDEKNFHGSVNACKIMLDLASAARLGDFGYPRARPSGLQEPSYELDVLDFGALVLEVVCGRKSTDDRDMITESGKSFTFLVDWVWALHEEGRIHDAVDATLRDDGKLKQEAKKLLVVGLACSHPEPRKRPWMGEVFRFLDSNSSQPPDWPLQKPEPTAAHQPGPSARSTSSFLFGYFQN